LASYKDTCQKKNKCIDAPAKGGLRPNHIHKKPNKHRGKNTKMNIFYQPHITYLPFCGLKERLCAKIASQISIANYTVCVKCTKILKIFGHGGDSVGAKIKEWRFATNI
jgi:hypothetical protein